LDCGLELVIQEGAEIESGDQIVVLEANCSVGNAEFDDVKLHLEGEETCQTATVTGGCLSMWLSAHLCTGALEGGSTL